MDLNRVRRLVADHSPVILSALGVAGTAATAVLAAKGAVQAEREVQTVLNEKAKVQDPSFVFYPKPKEYVQITWKCYVPAIVVGSITVTCIVFANTISTRRQVALAGAYAISDKAFADYKAKVIEQHGENKERQVREAVLEDKLAQNPVSQTTVIVGKGGDVLCYDSFTDRYFRSDMETLRKAQNDINMTIIDSMYASLNDFYKLIGLGTASVGDDLGFTLDNKLDLVFSTLLSDESEPAICVAFRAMPIRDYYQLGG